MIEIERLFIEACEETGVKKKDKNAILTFLTPLREKENGEAHYFHSLRVGLLAREVARFTGDDEKPLLMAGALHDVGKCACDPNTLGKRGHWNRNDQRKIRKHVLCGHRMLKGRFNFSAETIALHHHFQANPYPQRLPKIPSEYSVDTVRLIYRYGRIVALADEYDALHREHFKRIMTSEEILDTMFDSNKDISPLIEALYKARIFGE